jgi:hypothetical protein
MNPEGRIEVPNGLPGGDRQRQVLTKMLRPSPPERYQSAREVRQALLATEDVAAGRAVVPATPRAMPATIDLPAAPRPIEGPTAALLQRLAPSAVRSMLGSQVPSPGDRVGVGLGWLGFAAIGVVTFGILPLIYLIRSRVRRHRVLRFLRDGVPATAEIITMQDAKDDLGVKISRIRYQWQVDGQLHRDSDEVLAIYSDKWAVGEQIRILYLPDEGFNSLVISTT